MRVAVLVPVKAFSAAKVRLAPALAGAEREALARSMADRVLAAAAPYAVSVVCDDGDVAAWATERGAAVIWCPGRGLNAAVTDGVDALARDGADRVVVSHADLPLADGFGHVVGEADFAGVTLVPDRHDDGTNVLCLPAAAGFQFAYGPGSFGRHLDEAARLGLPSRVVRDARLGWDVDLPADLQYPTSCS